MRRAVIDIGTNSVKLLVADLAGGNVVPLEERATQTRLGLGLYETHQLQPEPLLRTTEAVAEFASAARRWQVDAPRIIATSAARDAVNRDDLVAAIRRAASLDVEIISGEQEADWVFRGVSADPSLAGHRLMILDVGGGSTEIILGEGGHHSFRRSYPLGGVRLLEMLRPADPPTPADLAACQGWLGEFFRQDVAPAVEAVMQTALPNLMTLVGTGGAAVILARMDACLNSFDHERIDGYRLTRERLCHWMTELWKLPLAERRKIVGLPLERADIILTGAAIYDAVAGQFDFPELRVSVRGLRHGALLAS